MLKRFSVRSFKNFNEELIFDLTSGQYEFNSESTKNGLINTGIIYGENTSGKTNLIYALMDITTHLTDNHVSDQNYRHFLNLDTTQKSARFVYEFEFNGNHCVYAYEKEDFKTLNNEKLQVNNDIIFEFSHINGLKSLNLKGTETLNVEITEKKLSFLKYLFKNAIYTNDPYVDIINSLEEFVEGMLTFNSIDGNSYQGFKVGNRSVSDYIIKNNHLKHFEDFLHNLGIKLSLINKEVDGDDVIFVRYDSGKEARFNTVASKGTKALALLYRWLMDKEKIKLLLIDEFDAYYHHSLSKHILKFLRDSQMQTIVTTHNTSIMTNDILRPDCYFVLENNEIHSIAESTNKELRKAHNIEKMYRAGAFNHE